MFTFYHETVPNSPGIYKITCTVTGKFYIGSAINLRRRRKEHFGDLQRNEHGNPKLQRAWQKYGENAFVFEVWELVLVPEMLTAREQYWFNHLKPFGKKGFNIDRVAGSCLGVKRSAETREKHRIASLGRTHSAETRARLKVLRRERGTSPLQREQVRRVQPLAANARRKTLIAISPDGTEYVFDGIAKCCEEHHLQPSHLLNVARGKYLHHKGWTARFPDADAG